MGWYDRVRALLGVSSYDAPRDAARSLGSPEVERTRRAFGGQLQLQSLPQTRWYLDDVEDAEHEASRGVLCRAARLVNALKSDGVVKGALQKRTAFVRLPRIFKGRPDSSLSAEIVAALQVGYERSLFDELCPASAIELLGQDGLLLGVGVGYLQPVVGRQHPVLVRLSPEFLTYRHYEDRWFYSTTAGELPVTPGDGTWVLHLPGGRLNPWEHGDWRAVGTAWVRKDHASNALDNWEASLANPLRVAVAPRATDSDGLVKFFEQLINWGRNTVISMLPGWEIKLVESSGEGADSFRNTIKAANEEILIALLGQLVTTTGGTGFANSGVHEQGEASLIGATANAVANTINTQVLPAWVVDRFGEEALDESTVMGWDISPAKDLKTRADALGSVANAVERLTAALEKNDQGLKVDFEAILTEFGVPIRRAVEAQAVERPKPRLVREAAA